MGSVDIVLPSRETYPDSQNLRSDGAKIRRIIESPNLGLFLLQDDFSCKVLLYFQFYLYTLHQVSADRRNTTERRAMSLLTELLPNFYINLFL